MLNVKKLDVTARARIAVMRAVGYTNREIAQELGVSEANITYYVKNLRKRASETSPELALAEVLIAAMPFYPMSQMINLINKMQRGR